MRYLLLPITALATITLLWLAKPVLVPVLLAALLAQLLVPLVSRLERRVPRALAAALAPIVVAIAIFGAMSLVVTQLADLVNDLPGIVGRINDALDAGATDIGKTFGVARGIPAALISKGLEATIGSGGTAALAALTTTVETAAGISLIVILTFLMLHYRHHFRRQLKAFGERLGASTTGAAIDGTVELMQRYVSGIGIVMLITGTADALLLWTIGAPFPALFGLLGALAVLVPYVGIAIVAPMAATITWLATASPGVAGGVLIVYGVVHLIEGNLISPYLVGSKVQLNPLSTILAILAGGTLWGPAGMVLLIPLVGLLRLVLATTPHGEPISRLLGPVADEDIKPRKRQRIVIPQPPKVALQS